MLLKLVPSDTNINFIGYRKLAYFMSLIIVLGSLGLLFTRGLNLGIDFTGGTLIEVRVETAPDIQELRADLNGLGLGSISIQEFGDPLDLLIRMAQQDGEETTQQEAIDTVKAKIGRKWRTTGINGGNLRTCL